MTAAERSKAQPGVPVLEARGVTVRFSGVVALSDVSLTVEEGTIVGLVGPNGAGKSTFFAVASGLRNPNGGVVLMRGEDITHASAQSRGRRGMARTFQQPELFTGLTVREHLVLAHRVHHDRRRLWTDLVSIRAWRPAPKDENDRVDSIIDLLDIGGLAKRRAVGLPLGSSRLVEIGRALATDPAILLLDEPASGLGGAETERLAATLSQVSKDRAVAVLIVEHDVEMVLGISNTVHVLEFGTKIASGTPSQIRADPAVRRAYLGDEPVREVPA
jgi:branched-chain amino acid transport system ATP-binding protein